MHVGLRFHPWAPLTIDTEPGAQPVKSGDSLACAYNYRSVRYVIANTSMQ